GGEAMQYQTANTVTGLKKGFRALHVGGMFGHSVKYSVTGISHEREPEFSDTCRADTQVCPYQQTGLAPDGNSTEENPNFQIGSKPPMYRKIAKATRQTRFDDGSGASNQ